LATSLRGWGACVSVLPTSLMASGLLLGWLRMHGQSPHLLGWLRARWAHYLKQDSGGPQCTCGFVPPPPLHLFVLPLELLCRVVAELPMAELRRVGVSCHLYL